MLSIGSSCPRIELDFARTRPRVNKLGLALLAAGVIGTAVVLLDCWQLVSTNKGLEVRIAALAPAGAAGAARSASAARADQDAADALDELTAPWSVLLRELELASVDSQGAVAVLAVEPDRAKRKVHVLAEARSLPNALTYVERLQQSHALRYPMLENHEVQTKDPEHPVRFEVTADWRLLQ